MENNLIRWIRSIPNWVKSSITLISTVVGFLLLLRTDPQLTMIVIGFLGIGALVVSLVYLSFAKSRSQIVGGGGVYRYKSIRPYSITCLVLVIIAVGLVVGFPKTREIIIDAIIKSEKNHNFESTYQDIVVAQFDSKYASRTIELSRRIETELKEKLQRYGLDRLTVRVLDYSIKSEKEADTLLAYSKAVIWGWYDDLGINIQIAFRSKESVKPMIQMPEITWNLADKELQKVSIVVHDILPENVTFLSLFVIGNIAYQTDDYKTGQFAYNAAMENIPENSLIEHEALIHFFNARLMQLSGNTDWEKIICSYSKAAKCDPTLIEAYNNIGILLSKHLNDDSKLTKSVVQCLEDIGIKELKSNTLFEKVLKIQPNFTLARYNSFVTKWNQQFVDPVDLDELKKEAEKLYRLDKTIPGLNVLLGSFALDEDSLERATMYYKQAMDVVQGEPKIEFNLAQTYFLLGDYNQAIFHYESVLKRDSSIYDAWIGLAIIALQGNQLDKCMSLLNKIPIKGAGSRNIESEILKFAMVLRANVSFELGQIRKAITQLKYHESEETFDGNFILKYIQGLLYYSLRESTNAISCWNEICTHEYDIVSEETGTVNHVKETAVFAYESNEVYLERNYPLTNAWRDLVQSCGESHDSCVIFNWGEQNKCLPQPLNDRIKKIFSIIRHRFGYRLFYRREIKYAIGYCPYILTYDSKSHQWQFDTHALYGLEGKQREKTQVFPLNRFDGRIRLSEQEQEISFIDLLYVVVTDSNGLEHRLLTKYPELLYKDNQYLALRQGDDVLLSFLGYNINLPVRSVEVICNGYYIPNPRSVYNTTYLNSEKISRDKSD